MKNREPTWEETRDGIEHHHADDILGLPWLAYAIGLFDRDVELLGMALALWAVAVLIWTPWIMLRVRMNDPTGDAAPAVARLGIGLLPWIVLVVAFPWVTTVTGLAIAFPLFFLWGAGAMIMAAFHWPRLKSRRQRTSLLLVGGASYGIFALFFLGVLGFGFTTLPSFFFLVCLILGGLAAAAAIGTFVAAGSPPRTSGKSQPT